MNIPQITNIDTALAIYYNHVEIGNKEIKKLFGARSSATVARMKREVKTVMDRNGISSYSAYKINTIIAYQVWGIDVVDLEKRKQKITELNLSGKLIERERI